MEVKFKKITIKDLFNGYTDNNELGVRAYGGKLDVRPPYQREFVYKDTQRNLVIDSILKGFPLNLMYWAVRDDGSFEIIDGQQRTISICQYMDDVFSVDGKYFRNQLSDKQKIICDYKLMVYLCIGTPTERLEWFKTINIAGEELTDQELRNAVYSGSWVTSAKKYFSRKDGPAYNLGNKYLAVNVIRQEYLETVIKWISNNNIKNYMSLHQHDENAHELWEYFNAVITWCEKVFTNYRNEMKYVDWGWLYNLYKDKIINASKLEEEIKKLMEDEDVTFKKGIYPYILTGKEKYLNIRSFNENQKRSAYERQNGVCAKCNKNAEINDMEADHITPWSKGGKTELDNCQILCVACNRIKTNQ